MYIATPASNGAKSSETPSVFNIRYLGAEGGIFRLEAVDDYGSRIAIFECSSPCLVVKRTIGGVMSKEAVQQGSLLHAALLDASNGLLAQSKSASASSSTVTDVPSGRKIGEQTSNVRVPIPPIISGKWSNYRTTIMEGWSTEPTFGDRYVVIRMGCGTGCTFNIVGDHKTGRIYNLGLGGEDMQMLDIQFSNRNNQIKAQWENSETNSCVRQTFVWTGVALSPSSGEMTSARPDGGCPSAE